MDILYKHRYTKAFLIRFLIVIITDYAEFTLNILSYTDIDYHVYTDGAKYVCNSESPYKRETFRYSPLMAYIMIPNIYISRMFGKFLFCFADVVCAYYIENILKKKENNYNKDSYALNSVFQLYNPISIAICTRGSSDSLTILLLFYIINCIQNEKILLSGVLFGLIVHFRIYPIIYSVALFLFISFKSTSTIDNIKESSASSRIMQGVNYVLNILKQSLNVRKNSKAWLFFISSIVTFIILNYIFYVKYGYQYLHEALLYHFIRKDHRHNYSLYNYMIYLTYSTTLVKLISVIAFIPQMLMILTITFTYFKDIDFCIVLITLIFVHFNKVITAQYFLWYLTLFPFILHKNKFFKSKAGLLSLAIWLGLEVIWNYYAHILEYKRINAFTELFIIEALFFLINCYVIKSIIKNRTSNITIHSIEASQSTLKNDNKIKGN